MLRRRRRRRHRQRRVRRRRHRRRRPAATRSTATRTPTRSPAAPATTSLHGGSGIDRIDGGAGRRPDLRRQRRRLHRRRRRRRRDRRRRRRGGARHAAARAATRSTSRSRRPRRPTTPASTRPARARRDCEIVAAHRRRAGPQQGRHVPRADAGGDARRHGARRRPARRARRRHAARARRQRRPVGAAPGGADVDAARRHRRRPRRRHGLRRPRAAADLRRRRRRLPRGRRSATARSTAARATTRSACAARARCVVQRGRRPRHDLRPRRRRARTIGCGAGRDVAHVDGGDTVARDCERVIGHAPAARAAHRRPRARAARARPPRARARTRRPTPISWPRRRACTHWWRMCAERAGRTGRFGPVRTYAAGSIDRITKTQGALLRPVRRPGPDRRRRHRVRRPLDVLRRRCTRTSTTPQLRGDVHVRGLVPRRRRRHRAQLLDDVDADRRRRPASRSCARPTARCTRTISLVRPTRAASTCARAPLHARHGRWHHVALTRTADRIAIYVDGALVAEGPREPVTIASYRATTGTSRGELRHGYGRGSAGIDEFAIYDRALDAATIRAHARAGEDGRPPVTRTPPPFGAAAAAVDASRRS